MLGYALRINGNPRGSSPPPLAFGLRSCPKDDPGPPVDPNPVGIGGRREVASYKQEFAPGGPPYRLHVAKQRVMHPTFTQ